MTPNNMLNRVIRRVDRLPDGLKSKILSLAFGRYVPLVGTAGVVYKLVSPEKVICTLKNHRAVQNHINGIHAVAMALVAETATGFITALNMPDTHIVLIKSMTIHYKKVCVGAITATATLTAANREFIATTEKGELSIPVVLTDESGTPPVEIEMIWAWRPKTKKSA